MLIPKGIDSLHSFGQEVIFSSVAQSIGSEKVIGSEARRAAA